MNSTPPTAAERKLIRWLFGPLLLAAAVFIGWNWHARAGECRATCRAQGFQSGDLQLHGGTRLELGSHCECVKE